MDHGPRPVDHAIDTRIVLLGAAHQPEIAVGRRLVLRPEFANFEIMTAASTLRELSLQKFSRLAHFALAINFPSQ
jgi:hypothetical protein